MESLFDASDLFAVFVGGCIFLLGFILGRVNGKASASRKLRSWDSVKK